MRNICDTADMIEMQVGDDTLSDTCSSVSQRLKLLSEFIIWPDVQAEDLAKQKTTDAARYLVRIRFYRRIQTSVE